MKIWERFPGKWYIRYQHNGKQVWRMVGTTKSEAMAALKQVRKQIALDSLDLPDLPEKKKIPKILFEDLAQKYLNHCLADKADRTYRNELKRMNGHWLPMFRGRLIDEIKPLEIQEWRQMRLSNGISQRTVYNDLQSLKTMFSRARDWGLFKGKEPTGRLPKLYRKPIKIYTPDQATQYLQACSPSYYPIAVTLLFTGIRSIELKNLEKTDVDLVTEMISIRPTASLKNERGRSIPINSQLKPILESQINSSMSKFVFPGRDGIEKRSSIRHGHYKARKILGFTEMKLNHLRHMFASLMLAEGRDPAAVAELMGHGGLKITMEIYHHLHPERARRVVENMPIIIPKNNPGSHMVA